MPSVASQFDWDFFKVLKIRLLLLKPGLYKINGDTQPNKACNRVSLKCHWSTICFLLFAPLTKSFLPHSRTIPRIFRGGRKKRGAPWHQGGQEGHRQPCGRGDAGTWARRGDQRGDEDQVHHRGRAKESRVSCLASAGGICWEWRFQVQQSGTHASDSGKLLQLTFITLLSAVLLPSVLTWCIISRILNRHIKCFSCAMFMFWQFLRSCFMFHKLWMTWLACMRFK